MDSWRFWWLVRRRVWCARTSRTGPGCWPSGRPRPAATRMTGLMGLAGTHHDVARIVERDRDGHREVELGGPAAPAPVEGEAA